MNRALLFCVFFIFVTSNPLLGQEKHILSQQGMYSLAFSPDGKLLAVGDGRHNVLVWDVLRGKLLHHLSGHANVVTALAWSQDGKTVIAASTSLGRGHVSKVEYWDVKTGKEIKTQNIDGGGANRAISAGGSLLVTVGGFPNKIAKVWNLKKNTATILKGHKHHVSLAALAADGKKVATSDGERIRIWELPSGKKLATFVPKGGKAAERLAFTPEGKSIVYENRPHGYVHFVDIKTGKRKSVVIRRWITSCFAVSPDGEVVATAAIKKGFVDFWSIKTGKKLASLPANQPLRGIKKMAFSPDGRWLLAGGAVVHIWEVPKLMP